MSRRDGGKQRNNKKPQQRRHHDFLGSAQSNYDIDELDGMDIVPQRQGGKRLHDQVEKKIEKYFGYLHKPWERMR